MAAPVQESPEPLRCAFFVLRKKRSCKMIVGKGKRFCGEHAAMEEGSGSRRIVCPLDPKHTVSEDKLQKHLKKCNSREKPKPVYYVEDANSGSGDEADSTEVSLSERSPEELLCLMEKLQSVCRDLQCELEEQALSHAALQEELNNPKNGESAHKHLRQQSSILAHMAALGLLRGRRCFVEFGAGRGKLSHWIREALRDQPELQLLLVERSSTRFKVDGKHADAGAEFERLQVDIQHLDLSRVPLLQEKRLPVVGVGKHLCGAATDLALRCLLGNPHHSDRSEPPLKRPKPSDPDSPSAPPSHPSPPPSHSPSVVGLTVALCCHHRCQWKHYVGKDFFTERGLGERHFSAFCRMSSWATCGYRPANQSAVSTERTNESAASTERTNESAASTERTNESAACTERTNESAACTERTNESTASTERTNESAASTEPANQSAEQKDCDRAEEEHEPAEATDAMNEFLSAAERERVGRLCKLLIDRGRLHFLQDKGFRGRLVRYASSEVTLENVLLTAVPTAHFSTH